MANEFVEGTVKYPEDLPCPQVDTDLVPRERRYISDISSVRNLRMFQQEFQATRNRISFIFTEEEAREFREWYEGEIIHGGAWFYADWPILHKDKKIAYRFVGQPKWEWLLGANPGYMGRSVAGYNPASDAVTVYKVTATVELYERKVGKLLNVYTSKIYPYYFTDDIFMQGVRVKALPYAAISDFISTSGKIIIGATYVKYIYSSYDMEPDEILLDGKRITAGTTSGFVYSSYAMSNDDIFVSGQIVTDGRIERQGYIHYDYFDDRILANGKSIISGEIE